MTERFGHKQVRLAAGIPGAVADAEMAVLAGSPLQ